MTAWLLPEQFSDVLPGEARVIERLRRRLLDRARSHGYELVIPPLLEYVDSLLSGSGQDLELKTFKLVDQLSGRTLGLRADMTPQAARIDAHLLNRAGIARLCYCGSVVHTRAHGAFAGREPLQFGAELYGHAGLEADIEVQRLAVRCVRDAAVGRIALALCDVRIVRGVLAGMVAGPERIGEILAALALKDRPRLSVLAEGADADQRRALLALTELYGDAAVIDEAARVLPDREPIRSALADLRALVAAHEGIDVQIDLADLRGHNYHSGVIFTLYAEGRADAVARGGRYDEIGAGFGRPRPATGFSLDLRELARAGADDAPVDAIRAEWSGVPGYRAAVESLRDAGETVVELPAGAALEGDGFAFGRELALIDGRWQVRALSAG